MNDIQKEFLEILAQVRAHLEYQRALGIQAIEQGHSFTRDTAARPEAAKRSSDPISKTPSAVPDAAGTKPADPALEAGQPLALDAIREEIGECTRCKLSRGRTTIVFGEGDPRAAVMFIGEGPGFEEDQQGRPFVGAAGQLLTDIIVKGMKIRREDVYICNIVKCRPPNNRNPELDEVAACIGFVKKQIKAVQPTVIVTLGNVPTQNLLGTKQGITRMRGNWQEYQGIPVMPTFHPSYLLRSPGEKKHVWTDIQQVMKKLGMVIPEKG